MTGVSQRIFLARRDVGPCLVMLPLVRREGREELPYFPLNVPVRHAGLKVKEVAESLNPATSFSKP